MKSVTSERRGHDVSAPERVVLPLYTIADKRHEFVYPVELWVGYGPVAPRLWTTNGSTWYVARLTADYVRSGYFEIRDKHIEADFLDARSIRNAIQRVIETTDQLAQSKPAP